jgi:hypothetical protein
MEAIQREKKLLPFGWGRFGKSLDQIAAAIGPDEQLLAACVGLNPTFEHRSVTLVGGLRELTESTNVVLAATDRRLLLIPTGAGGAPRDHSEIPYAGMSIEESGKREVKLTWPDGSMVVKGIAKPMLPGFVAAVQRKLAG